MYPITNNLRIIGSISPYSNKNGNCPGYLFNINDQRILLDCGFGVCKNFDFPKDFKNLSIFISHFHKDHYTDIYAIAYASYVYNKLGLLKDRIKVYIPKTDSNNPEYLDYLLLNKHEEHYFEIIEYEEDSIFKIDDIEISFLKNYHSIDTYSIKLSYDNKSFVYASDLGFNTKDKIIDFSKNANLLLIESSFVKGDNQKNDFHLHAYEAAIIAKYANVDKLILTHFWPPHDKKEYLLEATKIFKNTHLAKDGKNIKI